MLSRRALLRAGAAASLLATDRAAGQAFRIGRSWGRGLKPPEFGITSLSAPTLTKTSAAGSNPMKLTIALGDPIDHTANRIIGQRTNNELSAGVPNWAGSSLATSSNNLDGNQVEGNAFAGPPSILVAPMPTGINYIRFAEQTGDGKVTSPWSNVVSDNFTPMGPAVTKIASVTANAKYASPYRLAISLPAGRTILAVATENAYLIKISIAGTTYTPIATVTKGSLGDGSLSFYDVMIPSGGISSFLLTGNVGFAFVHCTALQPYSLSSYSGNKASLPGDTYRSGPQSTGSLTVTGFGLCIIARGTISLTDGTLDFASDPGKQVVIAHRTTTGAFAFHTTDNYSSALAIDFGTRS